MNRTSHKCQTCKKAFRPLRIGQKFCSGACRQSAYRRRKRGGLAGSRVVKDKTLTPATCDHCGGGFWASGIGRKPKFCSTSCRTLHHRAMKQAMPAAIEKVYGVPEVKAHDLIDTQPVERVKTVLINSGYGYNHGQREWVLTPRESAPFGDKERKK